MHASNDLRDVPERFRSKPAPSPANENPTQSKQGTVEVEIPKPLSMPAPEMKLKPRKIPKQAISLKSTHQARAQHTAYLNTSFDLRTNKVPVPFYGHDIEQIYEAFNNRQIEAQKDEFETTEQYQKRLANNAVISLYGNVTSNGVFAFTFTPQTNYDADSKTFTTTIVLEHVWSHSAIDHTKVALTIKSESQSKATIGQNAFGAKLEMTERYGKVYGIAIHNLSIFDTKTSYDQWELNQLKSNEQLEARMPSLKGKLSSNITGTPVIENKLIIPSVEARRLKDKLSLLIIGKSVYPNISDGAYLNKATYDSPTESFQQFFYIDMDILEFWIYDKSTGKIFCKINRKTP